MSEQAAPAAEAVSGPVDYQPPALSQEALSLDDAMRLMNEPPKKPEAESAEAEPPATAEQESASKEADAAPDEGTTVEDPENEPELPAIDPPRSWSKDAHERWSKLDRETQEFLASRDSEDQKAIKRSFNEAADQRKALEAERQQLEQARKQYEAKLPALLESLQRQSEFADIKSIDDVKRLQREDPFRFQAWQVYQMDAQALEAERRAAEERQTQERQLSRTSYVREQDAKLKELIPEMSDPAKASELGKKAASLLADEYGFTQSELAAIAQTDEGYKLLNDARWQKLIADGVKYSELRKAPPKATQPPVPKVQRPGVRPAPGAAQSQSLQALNQKLSASGSVDDAMALLYAQRKAS